MNDSNQSQEVGSVTEYIEQRDFALQRCSLLRAQVEIRDKKILKLEKKLKAIIT